jgi:hypothetical protein
LRDVDAIGCVLLVSVNRVVWHHLFPGRIGRSFGLNSSREEIVPVEPLRRPVVRFPDRCTPYRLAGASAWAASARPFTNCYTD